MIAVSPLGSSHGCAGEDRDHMAIASASSDVAGDLDDGLSVLDDINFDDLFMGLEDGDIIPDLEVDPDELFGDYSVPDEDGSDGTSAATVDVSGANSDVAVPVMSAMKEEQTTAVAAIATPSASSTSAVTEVDKRRKSSPSPSKANGKRKVKVDWTPELHRRFVQAVEQLGVDKAVPSRILELMGIDCLTRHNIASHLQKYRSHRKHLMAREAEAASWSQRRQIYTAAGGGGPKREVSPWLAPTMGFPHHPPPPLQHFRPLHVWGHPSIEQPAPPTMAAPQQPWTQPSPGKRPPGILPWSPLRQDPAFWHQQPFYPMGPPSALTQGTPCYPHPNMRFQAHPMPAILPHPMYRPLPLPSKQSAPGQIALDAHPTSESIDAAIGDAIAKPWLPLPLGLKPPSLDSVMGELQRQGISKVPPVTCGSSP